VSPSDGERLGVGVVGLHEGRTMLVACSRTSNCVAVGGCDLNPGTLSAIDASLPGLFLTTDYRQLLARPDVDVVSVFTPDALHADHVIAAFEAGKHVTCTKPLTVSLADGRRLLAAARRTGRRLLVGQSTRFFEPFRRQRDAFDHGELGSLELVDAHYVHRMDWFYDKSPWAVTDTDWVFLGMSHPLDLLRWYLGPIAEVQAYGAQSALARERRVHGNDIYVVNVRASDGRLGRAMGNYGLHELPSARNAIELLLYGSLGTSQAQYHDMRYRFRAADGTEVTEDSLYAKRTWYFNDEVHGMHYGEFANYLEAFAAAILSGTPTSPELEEGLEVVCLMEGARRSAAGAGLPVRLDALYEEVGLSDVLGRST
jgi:predicted dehydrogenase